MPGDSFADVISEISSVRLASSTGHIAKIVGLVMECQGPAAGIGEMVQICSNDGVVCKGEVVGFRDSRTLVMPLAPMEGIRPGMAVVAEGSTLSSPVGAGLLGRVIDGLGEPMDGKGALSAVGARPIYAQPPNALQRRRISEPMLTGIRAVDSFLTLGRGQRVGIFAGSGVGKSVTLGMIARNCLAQVNVIALIGERGREVREFIEKDLGPQGMAKSVVVVATSDQPALVRLKASLLATTIAEWFRDRGDDVLLLLDSSTRLAMAQREVGLAVGEPPATKGYPPSVFAFLPRLFERAGTSDKGSITGLYTVLVEGDDLDDPIADSARSILDGHIVLSRRLANRNHYPAIDILASISRCRPDVTSKELRSMTGQLLRGMAVFQKNEDLVNIGAYAKGSDPELDLALRRREFLDKFLIQGMDEKWDPKLLETSVKALVDVK